MMTHYLLFYFTFDLFFFFFFFFIKDVFFFFFFFQAEDGIRDLYVTGVQTCDLPIWFCCCRFRSGAGRMLLAGPRPECCRTRSEERRVGKERRSPGSPHPHQTDG